MNAFSRLLSFIQALIPTIRGSPDLSARPERTTADDPAKRTTQIRSVTLDIPFSIADLALHLAGQTDINMLLHQSAQWLNQRAGVPLVIIYQRDPAVNWLANPIVVGGEVPDLPQQIKLGSGILGDVAVNRQPYYVDAVPLEKRLGPTLPSTQVAYVLPLAHETTLFGVMALHCARENALSEPARIAYDRVAALLSRLLATASRLSDSQQAIQRFDRFQRLAQDLTARLSSRELLQRIVDAAREMLDAQMGILLDADAETLELRPVAWSGIGDETAQFIRSRFKEDLKGLVAWARRPARTPDLRLDQRTSLATQAIVSGMLAELAAPVLYFDQLYGILAIETNKNRHFTDEEMGLLEALASHAGIALHNARLFEALEARNRQLEKANADLVISQQQTENARTAAVQANRLKTQFINNMSHELRTPLNAIINFTRIVSDGHAGPVTPEQVTYLGYVHEGGQHLLGLINDILDLAKIEAGKMELNREMASLEPIFKGVLSTLVGLTRDKGLILRNEAQPNLPLLNIDVRRIRQVMLNLVSNAAKFTERGSITLRAERRDQWVIVSVKDTGIGIKHEDMAKVFEEFQQVENTLQDNTSGTGLGMPISRRFVQLHGGDMWLESEYGVGTTVYFSLPI